LAQEDDGHFSDLKQGNNKHFLDLKQEEGLVQGYMRLGYAEQGQWIVASCLLLFEARQALFPDEKSRPTAQLKTGRNASHHRSRQHRGRRKVHAIPCLKKRFPLGIAARDRAASRFDIPGQAAILATSVRNANAICRPLSFFRSN
jgi:hypothetical protein